MRLMTNEERVEFAWAFKKAEGIRLLHDDFFAPFLPHPEMTMLTGYALQRGGYWDSIRVLRCGKSE